MFSRHQVKAAWPVEFFNNDKFWTFVSDKRKEAQVVNCLKFMEFKCPSNNFFYSTLSPTPSSLVQELFTRQVFSLSELQELMHLICYRLDTYCEILNSLEAELKSAWPVNEYKNDEFWEFVYNKNKPEQVLQCLKRFEFFYNKPKCFNRMDYFIYSTFQLNGFGTTYKVVSPKPDLLVTALVENKIFSEQEMNEMASKICINKTTQNDFLSIISSSVQSVEKDPTGSNGSDNPTGSNGSDDPTGPNGSNDLTGPNGSNDLTGPNGSNDLTGPYYGQPVKTNYMAYLISILGVLHTAASFILTLMKAIANALAEIVVKVVECFSRTPVSP